MSIIYMGRCPTCRLSHVATMTISSTCQPVSKIQVICAHKDSEIPANKVTLIQK